MAMIVNIDQNMLDVIDDETEDSVKTHRKKYNIR